MSKFSTATVSIPVKVKDEVYANIGFTSLKDCLSCKHWNKSDTCKAFPKGIPEEIISGNNNHRKPLKDQSNDIVFEIKKRKINFKLF